MVQSLWPVDSSAHHWRDSLFAGNEREEHLGPARERQERDLPWRCTPGMKLAGTVDVGPPYQESVLDSSPLGTFVTSALAEQFSGCKVDLQILLACLNF